MIHTYEPPAERASIADTLDPRDDALNLILDAAREVQSSGATFDVFYQAVVNQLRCTGREV